MGLDKADLFGSIHATGYGRGQRHRDAFYYPGIDSIRDWSLSAVVYPVHSSRQVFCIFCSAVVSCLLFSAVGALLQLLASSCSPKDYSSLGHSVLNTTQCTMASYCQMLGCF